MQTSLTSAFGVGPSSAKRAKRAVDTLALLPARHAKARVRLTLAAGDSFARLLDVIGKEALTKLFALEFDVVDGVRVEFEVLHAVAWVVATLPRAACASYWMDERRYSQHADATHRRSALEVVQTSTVKPFAELMAGECALALELRDERVHVAGASPTHSVDFALGVAAERVDAVPDIDDAAYAEHGASVVVGDDALRRLLPSASVGAADTVRFAVVGRRLYAVTYAADAPAVDVATRSIVLDGAPAMDDEYVAESFAIVLVQNAWKYGKDARTTRVTLARDAPLRVAFYSDRSLTITTYVMPVQDDDDGGRDNRVEGIDQAVLARERAASSSSQ